MWPWEHLAFGYLLYSPAVRARTGSPPRGGAVVALALGTQLPDLIDKPLAWTFEALPGGVLAHALPVAVPALAAVLLAAHRVGRTELGVALAVGYLSHLAGDALYPLLTGGGGVAVGFLLWPFVDGVAGGRPGLLANVAYYVGKFVAFLATPRGRVYAAAEVAFLALAAVVWLWDGRPGFGALRASVAAVRPG